MKYIETLREGERMGDIYLCKQRTAAVTKNGKPYENIILQDKTGIIDGKIWEPNSSGIGDCDAMDYVQIVGDVTNFNGQLQVSIKRLRKAGEGEYDTKDYFPTTSKDVEEMTAELKQFIETVKNPYLAQLLNNIFTAEFIEIFKKHSAAKSVHHGFIGGLLEHTLSVTKLCNFYCKMYPVLNRDLLITVAILHDIGKTKEIATFPENDYTDDGQLLGHIVIGSEMVSDEMRRIEGFPVKLASEVKHCILAHHGELEYGSPKKPALIEAVALNFADNTDAKIESMIEIFNSKASNDWLGYNKLFESNIRKTSIGE